MQTFDEIDPFPEKKPEDQINSTTGNRAVGPWTQEAAKLTRERKEAIMADPHAGLHADFSVEGVLQMMRTTSLAKVRAELEKMEKKKPKEFLIFACTIYRANKST